VSVKLKVGQDNLQCIISLLLRELLREAMAACENKMAYEISWYLPIDYSGDVWLTTRFVLSQIKSRAFPLTSLAFSMGMAIQLLPRIAEDKENTTESVGSIFSEHNQAWTANHSFLRCWYSFFALPCCITIVNRDKLKAETMMILPLVISGYNYRLWEAIIAQIDATVNYGVCSPK
jgi:hypothetical protein